MSRFCHYCSLLLLCCSFGSLCVRFLPPSKTACSSTPVLFSPPSPFCKNDGMHSTCHFMNFVCNLLFSLCISCFHTLFFHFFVIFSENLFPAIAGEYDFENRINAKSRQKELLRPSTRITSIVKLFMAPGLSKIGGNICISHLWALFGSSVCHDGIYCMHFG